MAGARLLYGLPYFWSAMRVCDGGNQMRYHSRRRWAGSAAGLRAVIEIGKTFGPEGLNDLDRFLTARWRLYSRMGRRPVSVAVHHAPWPLRRARVLVLDQTLTEAAGLPAPAGDPKVHFSDGVTSVRIGAPAAIDTR